MTNGRLCSDSNRKDAIARMDNTDWKIHGRLIEQWEDFELRIAQYHNSIELKSSVPNQKIAYAASDRATATFSCPETLINLPERAGRLHTLPLYLVFRGDLVVDKAHFAQTEELRTVSFRTQAGYFRHKSNPDRLKHIYGAHYDIDLDLAGHPRFHAQHCSQKEFRGEVERHLGRTLPFDDCMEEVLGSVRLPCAQMDFFRRSSPSNRRPLNECKCESNRFGHVLRTPSVVEERTWLRTSDSVAQ